MEDTTSDVRIVLAFVAGLAIAGTLAAAAASNYTCRQAWVTLDASKQSTAWETLVAYQVCARP